MRHRVGWLIPYHLQVLFAELRAICHDHHVPPTVDVVDRAFETLLSPGRRSLFDFWVQRLTQELGTPDDKQALVLANAAAIDEHGATKDTLSQELFTRIADSDERERQLSFLLDVLQSDGYLVKDGNRYRFRSSLLREFWVRRVIGE
jgi:hypothetical protein